jgi:hypothetical protein
MEVVRLLAWCDYVTEEEYRAEFARSSLPRVAIDEALRHFRDGVEYRVQELAVLADGRRLPLGDERGFGGSEELETLELLETDVRNTVLPDDDEPADEHPWAWLAEQLRGHGIDLTAEQLAQLPYDVEFSRRLLARVMARTLRRGE